jgi:hypothetical protein
LLFDFGVLAALVVECELFDVFGLFELVLACALAALLVRALGGRSACEPLLWAFAAFVG